MIIANCLDNNLVAKCIVSNCNNIILDDVLNYTNDVLLDNYLTKINELKEHDENNSANIITINNNFNPDNFNPDNFNPDNFNPDNFNPDNFNPGNFMDFVDNTTNEESVYKKTDEESDNENIIESECSICYENYNLKKFNFFDCCEHIFCPDCIFNYLSIKINEGDINIKCPDKNCQEHLLYNDIINVIKKDQIIRDKYETFLLNYVENQHLNNDIKYKITHCPEPSCNLLIEYTHNNNNIHIACPFCKKQFCPKCKNIHLDMTCEKYSESLKATNFDEWLSIKGKLVNECPKCKNLIEKNFGCNHMTCKVCKTEFCFICSHIYTKDDNHNCKDQIDEARTQILSTSIKFNKTSNLNDVPSSSSHDVSSFRSNIANIAFLSSTSEDESDESDYESDDDLW